MASSNSGEFEVVASGAAGNAQCDAGLYDYTDFLKKLGMKLEKEISGDFILTW